MGSGPLIYLMVVEERVVVTTDRMDGEIIGKENSK
jgi:hypothetical protein